MNLGIDSGGTAPTPSVVETSNRSAISELFYCCIGVSVYGLGHWLRLELSSTLIKTVPNSCPVDFVDWRSVGVYRLRAAWNLQILRHEIRVVGLRHLRFDVAQYRVRPQLYARLSRTVRPLLTRYCIAGAVLLDFRHSINPGILPGRSHGTGSGSTFSVGAALFPASGNTVIARLHVSAEPLLFPNCPV